MPAIGDQRVGRVHYACPGKLGCVQQIKLRTGEVRHPSVVALPRLKRERRHEANSARADRARATAGADPLRPFATGMAKWCRNHLATLREQLRDVALVTAEALVATVAVQRHRDVSAGQFGQIEARQRRGVRERLAVVPDHPWQDADRVRLEAELVMIGVISLGYRAGILSLVVTGLIEADREGLHAAGPLDRHRRHDRA